jgi:hypothetical protein
MEQGAKTEDLQTKRREFDPQDAKGFEFTPMTKQRRRLFGTVLLLALGAAWLFRTRTDRNDPRGVARYRWKWGRAVELSIDRDRDGRADVLVLYPGHFGDFAADDVPRELWADQNLDGRFDLTWRREPDLVVRRDIDNDGTLETVLRGEKALRFKSELLLFE